MKRTLNLGPLAIVHDEGIPLEAIFPEDCDELPPDVVADLLECPSVVRRCEEAAEDGDLTEVGLDPDTREALRDSYVEG